MTTQLLKTKKLKQTEDFIDSYISSWLLDAGVKPSYLGFGYIVLAVKLYHLTDRKLNFTGDDGLYNEIAKRADTTLSRVERAIRYACEHISNPDVLEGLTFQLTNSSVVAYLCARVSKELRESDDLSTDVPMHTCYASCKYKCLRSDNCIWVEPPATSVDGKCTRYTPY